MVFSCKLVQFFPREDVDYNFSIISSHILPKTITIFPEGSLSGYPTTINTAFFSTINSQQIRKLIDKLAEICKTKKAVVVCSGIIDDEGDWKNRTFVISSTGVDYYDKVNLATHERGQITAGASLDPIEIEIGAETIVIGIQVCRELKFPEQWQLLSLKHSDLLIHLNNAVGDVSEQLMWKSQLIARATENQRFVISVNAAAEDQKCPSMAIGPFGNTLVEMDSDESEAEIMIDPTKNSDWYMNQRATDVVEVIEHK